MHRFSYISIVLKVLNDSLRTSTAFCAYVVSCLSLFALYASHHYRMINSHALLLPQIWCFHFHSLKESIIFSPRIKKCFDRGFLMKLLWLEQKSALSVLFFYLISHYIINAGYIMHFYLHFLVSKRVSYFGSPPSLPLGFFFYLCSITFYILNQWLELLFAIVSWVPSQTQFSWRTSYSHLIYTTVSLGTDLTHMGTFCSTQLFSVPFSIEVWIKTQGSSFSSWREW